MNVNTEKPRGVRVTKSRDVRTHAELWHTSNCLLRAGLEDEKGAHHQFMASLVFRAFALEAYLNWLGQQLLSHWKYLERLTPKEKIEVIAQHTNVKTDYSRRPWQVINQLFGFRNDIAHGKPEQLNSNKLDVLDEHLDRKLGELLQTDWERFCTAANAQRAQEDVEQIAELLLTSSDLPHSRGAFVFGLHSHGAEILKS